MREIVIALRHLRSHPHYTWMSALTIVLGVGAITASLATATSVVLDRIPYPSHERLAVVFSTFPEAAEQVGSASYLDLRDIAEASRGVRELAAFSAPIQLNFQRGDSAQRVTANFVSGPYFELLGAQPAAGRTLTASEAEPPGEGAVVLLGYELWKTRLGSDPAVVGSTVLLNDLPHEVVGVMGADFADMQQSEGVDVWVPVGLSGSLLGQPYVEQRQARWLHALVLLEPGMDLAEARREMVASAAQLEENHPDTNRDISVAAYSLKDYFLRLTGLDRSIFFLLAAGVAVFVMAAFNLANLTLCHAASRCRELSIRIATGAGRLHVLRQLALEGVLLGVGAGMTGILLAHLFLRQLARLTPIPLPDYLTLELDPAAIAGGLLLALLLGLGICALGLAQLGGQRMSYSLQSLLTRSTDGLTLTRLRSAFVVLQVAGALALAVIAALTLHSFQRLQAVDVGFDSAELTTFEVVLGKRYDEPVLQRSFYANLDASLKNLSGVAAAGLWGPGRPGQSWWFHLVYAEGRDPQDSASRQTVFHHRITPGLLREVGLPLVRGREFTEQDRADSPPVAVVSESLAARLWPGSEAVGRRLRRISYPDEEWITVVGVASDARHRGRRAQYHDPVDLYLPIDQFPVSTFTGVLRSDRPDDDLARDVRPRLAAIDSAVPVFNLKPAEAAMGEELNELTFYVWLLGVFAAIAVALGAVGVYGVLAYDVVRRTREIGVRMALGARPGDIYRMVSRHGSVLLGVGLLLGGVLAYVAVRLVGSYVPDTAAVPPVIFIEAVALLVVIAAAAAYLPGRRAAAINPVQALKTD